MSKGILTFLQADKKDDSKPKLGSAFILEMNHFERGWYCSQDKNIDVAIIPMPWIHQKVREHDTKIFYTQISQKIIPSNEALNELDALEEVVFVGYPAGIWDKTNLLPILRKGITASPIAVDYDGQKKFLIDAAVFPGSSGSPVFLFNKNLYIENKTAHFGDRAFFLGILGQVFCQKNLNELKFLENSNY